MDITINYNGKDYKFNLFNETSIDEDNINTALKTHISSYAFLAMLHKKCIKAKKSLDSDRKRVYAQEYEKIKDLVNESTGRVYSNDFAKLKVERTMKYRKIDRACQAAEHNVEILEVCVKVYEDRKDLLQSLSANLRRENH